MNGEVKSYKVNDPMSWAEFKAMPDDIKITYITALRKRFNVSDVKIAEMMGVSQVTFSKEVRKLGIKSTRKSRETWDVDGWYAWVNGVPVEAEEKVTVFTQGNCFEFQVDDVDGEVIKDAREAVSEKCDEEVLEQAEKCDAVVHIVPDSGKVTMTGKAAECLETLVGLLGYTDVYMTVIWGVQKNEEAARES